MNESTPFMAKADLRGMVSKSLVDILRGLTLSSFGTASIGERIEETLILISIVVGHAEGRLMCASDIAAYIGLPRPTVVRKLRTVGMARMLGKIKQGNRACYYLKNPNDEKVIAEIRRLMATIKHCCDQLSKMDTQKLDR